MRTIKRRSSQRGSSLVEFAFVIFLLMLVIFASIEFDRFILVYTTVANAARAGARYAIVHGSDRSPSTGDPASGPGNTTNVETLVKQFAGSGMLTTANVNVTVEYPTDNKPGSEVRITVTYPYDPFIVLPLSVTLSSKTRGIIVY
jgi:Flp pilus assembly protein TadG